jgi:RNA polymerase sigma-70 factor (ECF subfamily)
VDSLQELTTPELVARARGGCRESFGILAERNAKGVYNFLLRRTRSHEDAEELCQESFLRAWRKLGLYHDGWRFSTWVFAIARSVAADRARAARVDATAADMDTSAASDDHARDLGQREEGENLWNLARSVLDEEQHSALWLYYAEDRSTAEIASILGRTSVSVRVMLFRARGVLGRHLEARQKRSDGSRGTLKTTPADARLVDTRLRDSNLLDSKKMGTMP